MSKQRYIHVPNSVIYKNVNNLSHAAFGLYVGLKILSYNNTYNGYIEKLMRFTKWVDNRTFKKHFDKLAELNLIQHDHVFLPKFEKLTIKIIDIVPFTQVNINTINTILDLTSNISIKGNAGTSDYSNIGLRLYYYYKKQYNEILKYAYPSFKNISDATGISSKQIVILNDIFEKNNLLTIEHGKWKKNDSEIKRKYNNKYIPLSI